MKRPGFDDCSDVGDGLFGRLFLTVVVGLGFDRGRVAGIVGDLAMETTLVEPVDVGHDCWRSARRCGACSAREQTFGSSALPLVGAPGFEPGTSAV